MRRNPAGDALTRENDELRRQLAELRRDPGDLPVTGCGDTSCVVASPKGMATNGGCLCDERTLRRAVHFYRRLSQFREQTIRDLRAQGSAVVEALDKLRRGAFELEMRCKVADTSVTIRAATSEHGAPYHVIRERPHDDVLVASVGTAQEAANCFATWIRDAQEKLGG